MKKKKKTTKQNRETKKYIDEIRKKGEIGEEKSQKNIYNLIERSKFEKCKSASLWNDLHLTSIVEHESAVTAYGWVWIFNRFEIKKKIK